MNVSGRLAALGFTHKPSRFAGFRTIVHAASGEIVHDHLDVFQAAAFCDWLEQSLRL